MWGKQTVSAEEMSQTLWKMCSSFTDDFCTKLTAKLQAQGFLRAPADQDAFAIEALQLHIWLISYVFTDDGAVLDALHNIFAAWDAANCQARASQTVRERFALYTKAAHGDLEMRAKGLTPTRLTNATIRCLLNTPDETTLDYLVGSEVGLILWSTFSVLQKFRAQVKIRKA